MEDERYTLIPMESDDPNGQILTGGPFAPLRMSFSYNFEIFDPTPKLLIGEDLGSEFPHVVTIRYLAYRQYSDFEAERVEMNKWCVDNLTAGAFTSTRDAIHFKSADDAFAFKMRWG